MRMHPQSQLPVLRAKTWHSPRLVPSRPISDRGEVDAFPEAALRPRDTSSATAWPYHTCLVHDAALLIRGPREVVILYYVLCNSFLFFRRRIAHDSCFGEISEIPWAIVCLVDLICSKQPPLVRPLLSALPCLSACKYIQDV
jgi:hypothetical protein